MSQEKTQDREFRQEIQHLINRRCMENGSNTPDFILAEYLQGCLDTFDKAVMAREKWYGRSGQGFGVEGKHLHVAVFDEAHVVPVPNPHAPQKISDFLVPAPVDAPPEDNGHSDGIPTVEGRKDYGSQEPAEVVEKLGGPDHHLDHGVSPTEVRVEG